MGHFGVPAITLHQQRPHRTSIPTSSSRDLDDFKAACLLRQVKEEGIALMEQDSNEA
jgi:hypothetical protein